MSRFREQLRNLAEQVWNDGYYQYGEASDGAKAEALELLKMIGQAVEALELAKLVFTGYAQLHRNKETEEGARKAEKNEAYAKKMEEALELFQ